MNLIPDKESLTVEFKSDTVKLPDSEIFEAVVAFANTEGGDLYLGVEDDGTVTGVNKAHKNPITLNAYIANNTVPPVSIRAEIIEDKLPVLRISVPKSLAGIVSTAGGKTLRRRIKADGLPENIPMFYNESITRMADLRLLDYTAREVDEADTSVFDPLEIERLRKTVLSYDGDKSLIELSDEDLFKALGFVRERGGILIPTVAGILMSGKEAAIRRFIPTAQTSFQVLEGTSVRVNEDFVLPILASVEKLAGFLEAWNPSRELEMGMFRMLAPDYDKRALREAIVNAYSHRDYTKLGRVRVSVTDEGLTVANPGGFIEGISVNNLLTAEPHGRNPLLADAMKRVGLAEKTGRGIDRIYEGSLIYGRLLPDYSASTSVTVSLFIPKCAPDPLMTKLISDEQKRLGRPLPINTLIILNVLRDFPRSDINTISEIAKLPKTVTQAVLEQLAEAKLAESRGNNSGKTYTLSPKAYNEGDKNIIPDTKQPTDDAKYLKAIARLAAKKEFITRADVAESLNVPGNKAYRLLRKSVDNGTLTLISKGHYAKYKLNT